MKENEEFEKIFLIDDVIVTEEYFNYLYTNHIDSMQLRTCEYLGLFCRMNDVVKIINLDTKKVTYVAPGDEYVPYYYELMYPGLIYPWRDKKGSLKNIYNEFQKKGIKLKTTIYNDTKAKAKTYKKTK